MTDNQSVLAIIPARGGSKGVPRKNIRCLAGKPLIAHTIEAALNCQAIERVIVSTDDSEIAEVARAYGAEVPFLRPGEYATDTATSLSVVKHALTWFAEQENYQPEAIAILAPTSPLRTMTHIEDTIKLLWSTGNDSALTICEVLDHPYFIYEKTRTVVCPNWSIYLTSLCGGRNCLRSIRILRRLSCPVANILKLWDQQPIFNFQSMAGYFIDRDFGTGYRYSR